MSDQTPQPGDSWYMPGWRTLPKDQLVVLAWNAGAPAARRIRQDRLHMEWPALAYALDRLTEVQAAEVKRRLIG